MQSIAIPASIWLNLVVLAAVAGFVWFKLGATGGGHRRKRPAAPPRSRPRPHSHSGHAA